MTGEEVVKLACDACEALDCEKSCRKFEGHVAVETVKQALADEGIETSARDVFIRGLPVEWDLIVPRDGAIPRFNGLLYEPAHARIALEIKLSGICGDRVKVFDGMRKNFRLAKDAGVQCGYIGLCDRKHQAATTEKLGHSAFNLTWSLGNERREDSGDWPRLLKFLRSA